MNKKMGYAFFLIYNNNNNKYSFNKNNDIYICIRITYIILSAIYFIKAWDICISTHTRIKIAFDVFLLMQMQITITISNTTNNNNIIIFILYNNKIEKSI